MTYDNAAIREVVASLRGLPSKQRVDWCMQNHPEFASAFPALLKACSADDFDLRFLELMLEQRAQLQVNATDVDTADKTVYDALRENYITPLLRQQDDKK